MHIKKNKQSSLVLSEPIPPSRRGGTVFDIVDQLAGSLNACVADLADLFGMKQWPFLLMKLVIEIFDEFGMQKVNKGIADIAIALYKCFHTFVSMGR